MKQIEQWIKESEMLMELLNIVSSLNLPDGWISAGTLRNYIWNRLSGINQLEYNDVDVVYFDLDQTHDDALEIESYLNKKYPNIQWEVRNQALMHQHNFNDEKPYISTYNAISKYPETCTAIATRIKNQELEIMAPHGIDDLMTFKVKPTPHFNQNERYLEIYRKRIQQKQWQNKWPKLQIFKQKA